MNIQYNYAKYTSFSVGDSASKYTLSVSGYSGTAGDSLGNNDATSTFQGGNLSVITDIS